MMFYDLITPPSGVIRPPSNAALTFFRATAVAGNRWQVEGERDILLHNPENRLGRHYS